MAQIRRSSSPDFCPPEREGMCVSLADDAGVVTEFEFLGLILDGEARYGFFFPLDNEARPLDSGEVVVLQVLSLDEEGQPSSFESVDDSDTAMRAYEHFKRATSELYCFEN